MGAMLEKIIHQLPVRHAVVSAGHNKYRSEKEQLERLRKEAQRYRDAGRMVSYKFARTLDAAIDDNKALMPFLLGIPLVVFPVVRAQQLGLEVSVVGSREVEIVVNALAKYLEAEDQIKFVEEQKSFAQNIQAGSQPLPLETDQSFLFIPADVPLLWDIEGLLYDPDIANHDVVVDFNGRQRIFQNIPEFCPRNYYWKFTDDQGNIVEAKEPNPWVLSSRFGLELADLLYDNRQAGKLSVGTLLRKFGWEFVSTYADMSKESKRDMRGAAWSGIKQAMGFTSQLPFSSQLVYELGDGLLGLRIKAKAEHQDPARLKDVDAWHDGIFYGRIGQQLKEEKGGAHEALDAIMPHADLIIGFAQEVLPSIQERIGVLQDFPGYANFRAGQLGMEQQPYHSEGRIIMPAAPGEDIEAAVKYFVQKKAKYDSLKTVT